MLRARTLPFFPPPFHIGLSFPLGSLFFMTMRRLALTIMITYPSVSIYPRVVSAVVIGRCENRKDSIRERKRARVWMWFVDSLTKLDLFDLCCFVFVLMIYLLVDIGASMSRPRMTTLLQSLRKANCPSPKVSPVSVCLPCCCLYEMRTHVPRGTKENAPIPSLLM